MSSDDDASTNALVPVDPNVVPQVRVQPRIDLIFTFQHIAEQLFEATYPLRVNVRVATTSDPHYPVLGEALAPGAASLSGGISQLGFQGSDIHRQVTVTLMRESGQSIIQRDTNVDPPLVPHARRFGGQAGQMLTPLHHNGTFVGFLAVHSDAEVREWTSQDVAALQHARDEAERVLASAPWFEVPWPFDS